MENTAPRRAQPVTAVGFMETGGGISFRHNGMNVDMDWGGAAFWNAYIPLAPQVALEILSRDLPGRLTVAFDKCAADGFLAGRGHIHFELLDSRGSLMAQDSRALDLANRRVHDGYFGVAHALHGRGIGRTLMRNQIEFFHACGVRSMDISASARNGGYTWARVGFLPLRHGGLYGDFSRNSAFTQRAWALHPLLDQSSRMVIDRFLKGDDPHDLWAVADLETDIVPVLRAAFNPPQAVGKRSWWQRLCGGKKEVPAEEQALRSHFFEAYTQAARAEKPMKLGRHLLTGESWRAGISFDNPRQMQRVSDYTGGFKYIALN